jgi:hypothetical protein
VQECHSSVTVVVSQGHMFFPHYVTERGSVNEQDFLVSRKGHLVIFCLDFVSRRNISSICWNVHICSWQSHILQSM